jgi:DTW domain-containing protein YfiP
MTDLPTRCERCDKPPSFCVCDRITELRARTRVLVLQHPREQDRDLGTVSLLRAVLPDACEVRVGLSWASFQQCLGDEQADPKRWAILYPHSLKKPLAPALLKQPVVFLDREGEPVKGGRLEGIVALDGTWSQAKSLWWRNPWMLKLGRALVHPKEPSIYGKLRKEPRRDAVSTLEAVADALVANGEPEATRAELRKVFRTMVQRARDALGAQALAAPPEAPDED